MSERIKIYTSSTLTDFCFGFEDNREVEKDNEQEAENFDEDVMSEERRWKRNKNESKPSMSRKEEDASINFMKSKQLWGWVRAPIGAIDDEVGEVESYDQAEWDPFMCELSVAAG